MVDTTHTDVCIAEKMRDRKGKFTLKLSGTPADLLRREKDRERKKITRALGTFDRLTLVATQTEMEHFCLLRTKIGEVFYTGSDEFCASFKRNKPILLFEEKMIEIRRTSILQKLTKTN